LTQSGYAQILFFLFLFISFYFFLFLFIASEEEFPHYLPLKKSSLIPHPNG